MALMIDLAVDPVPDPRDYGLKDFYHNKEGQVDYTYFYDSSNPHHIELVKPEPRSKQTYKDVCTEQALDNMTIERERHAARCRGFKEYEQWLEEWN